MSLFPLHYLGKVVALGVRTESGEIEFSATGFLYTHRVTSRKDGKKGYVTFLVTNRHVVTEKEGIQVRFNRPLGSPPEIYPIRAKGKDGSSSWTMHPDKEVDVAVLSIDTDVLKSAGIEFSVFTSGMTFARDDSKRNQVFEGNGVFLLGFPLGLTGDDRNFAIVRSGTFARIQDWLHGRSKTFLIDALVFPGNSGGPVITKPELVSYGGNAQSRALLIGMVSWYLPYQEVAVSQQTGVRRIVFEENSGLAVVVPIDLIQETVELAVQKSVHSDWR